MIDSKIMISVIMITYNHEKYIKEAIEGVLMQECDYEIELIVADDKSPDNTESIVLELIKNHKNGHWIKYTRHEINKGMQPNFIWAYEQCKGKYIALCEGDDYWIDPLKLQKQVDFLENNLDYSFSMGRVDRLIEKTGEIKKKKEIVNIKKKEFLTLKDYLKGPISQTSSFVFRNDAKTFPEWFSKVHAGDQSLVIIKTGVNGKIKYHEECLSVYRINENSVSFQGSSEVYAKFFETLETWNKYLDFKYRRIIKIRHYKTLKQSEIIKVKGFTKLVCYKVALKLINLILKIV